jgi:hypothetical protein
MSLVGLPYELMAYVVQDLDLSAICSLSYTCKKFRFLVQEAKIAKRLLEVGFRSPKTETSPIIC